MVDKQTRSTTGCRRPRCCWRSTRTRSRRRETTSRPSASRRRRTSPRRSSSRSRRRSAKPGGRPLVGRACVSRAGSGGEAAPATYRRLKQAEREKARIEERLRRIAARALAVPRRAAANGRVGPTERPAADCPVGGGITSPFGYRTHPIYGYWGLHDGTDFGAGCGSAIVRRRVAARSSRRTTTRSTATGSTSTIGTVNGASVTTVYNHVSSLHRRHRRPRRPRRDRRLRRRRPAGPPAATCTSRCCATATRSTRWTSSDARATPLQPLRGWPDGQGAGGARLIAQNKKARHDYPHRGHLRGGAGPAGHRGQVAAEGRATLVDGFVDIDDGEAWLHGVHIPEYAQGTWTNHAARRKRKLLLNRAEIDKIERRVSDKGSPSSRSPSTSRTAAPRSRSRWPRARSRTTSGTRWPSGRPTGRRSRPSGVGSRASPTDGDRAAPRARSGRADPSWPAAVVRRRVRHLRRTSTTPLASRRTSPSMGPRWSAWCCWRSTSPGPARCT